MSGAPAGDAAVLCPPLSCSAASQEPGLVTEFLYQAAYTKNSLFLLRSAQIYNTVEAYACTCVFTTF